MLRYTLDAETSILSSLYAFQYLTVKQITRLLYSDTSEHLVSRLMKELWEPMPKKKEDRNPKKKYPEYVHRERMYSQSTVRQYVYWLSAKGRNRLRQFDYDFKGWKEPKEMATFVSSPHFRHYMMTTDFLIEATHTSDISSYIAQGVMHDFTLKRLRNAAVIPDGWIRFELTQTNPQLTPVYLWLEIDMGTEKRDRIQDKVWTIIDYIKTNGYQKDYQTPTPLIVFYCLSEKRRDELVGWIEEKLNAMYEPKKSRWFVVGCPILSPDMFFDTVWIQPNFQGQRKYVALLDG